MTVKLFDCDPYQKEAEAKVLSCKKSDDFYKVHLDQTIFYPRGGGQQADRGKIGGVPCVDVYEEDGDIVHVLDAPLATMDTVKLVLDWHYRYDNMKQHLGQHIFSHIVEDMYGIDTVSARIEDNSAHVELARELSYEQMLCVTDAVNKVIDENRAVSCGYFTKEQAADMGMPQKAFKHENIRIVSIFGLDKNPCGGTHPATTGEVEKCVITGQKQVRGVFRVYYKFGERATTDAHATSAFLWELQEFFGCEDKREVLPACVKLSEKCEKAVYDVAQLKEQLRLLECSAMLSGAQKIGDTLVVKEHFENKLNIKAAVDSLVLEHRAVVLVTNKIDNMLNLCLAQSKGASSVDLGAPVKEFLSAHNARGGGSKVAAQGMTDYSDEALKEVEDMFLKIISTI